MGKTAMKATEIWQIIIKKDNNSHNISVYHFVSTVYYIANQLVDGKYLTNTNTFPFKCITLYLSTVKSNTNTMLLSRFPILWWRVAIALCLIFTSAKSQENYRSHLRKLPKSFTKTIEDIYENYRSHLRKLPKSFTKTIGEIYENYWRHLRIYEHYRRLTHKSQVPIVNSYNENLHIQLTFFWSKYTTEIITGTWK